MTPFMFSYVASKRLAPGLGHFGYVGRTLFHIFWGRGHRECAKPGHWVVRLFSKACLAPLPFSLLRCVYIATVLLVLRLKPHDHISALSFCSTFGLDQWSLLKVILCRMTSRVFVSPKTSYRNELNQCWWSHCVQLAKTQKLICFWHSSVTTWP